MTRASFPRLSPAYERAYAALYDDPKAAELIAAGFHVEHHNNNTHWIISGHGRRFSYWPSANKWMIFGRVFQASVKAVIAAVEQGRFKMPDEAQASKCRECGADIWWTKSHKGRWVPLEADGDSHFGRCRP